MDYPNPFTKRGREYLKEVELSEVDRKLLEINLLIVDKIIQEKAKIDGDALLLITIQGISYCSTLLIKAEIGDVNQFWL